MSIFYFNILFVSSARKSTIILGTTPISEAWLGKYPVSNYYIEP